jgi:hypothetical protein
MSAGDVKELPDKAVEPDKTLLIDSVGGGGRSFFNVPLRSLNGCPDSAVDPGQMLS